MLAFTRATVMNDHTKSTGLLDKALEVLAWGQQEWATATRDDRGSVLEDTWIRGVRSMRLEHFVQVAVLHRPPISYGFKELMGSYVGIPNHRGHGCSIHSARAPRPSSSSLERGGGCERNSSGNRENGSRIHQCVLSVP